MHVDLHVGFLAAQGGRWWLQVAEFFSLLRRLRGISEVEASFACVAALSASGRLAATATTFTSAAAPATRQRHYAFFLDFSVRGNPVIAPPIKPEPSHFFGMLICCELDSKAVFSAWIGD
jgi:hypothetical protein